MTTTQLLRDRLVRRHAIDPAKIIVLPPSVEMIPLSHHTSHDRIPQMSVMKNNFIFFPAAARFSSNHYVFLIAYHLYKKRVSKPLKLVLSVHEASTLEPSLAELVEHFQLGEEVVILPHLSESDELEFFRAATFVVLPSLIRGLEEPMLQEIGRAHV